MKITFAVILLCFFITGCTSSIVINSSSPSYESSVDKFNEFAEGKEAEVVLNNHQVVTAIRIYIIEDSLHWSDPETKLKTDIVISDITKVTFIKSVFSRGIDGTGKGAIGGAAAGLLLAGLINETETAVEADLLAYIYLPVFGAFCGAVIGFPLGLIFSNSQEYEFQATEQEEINGL